MKKLIALVAALAMIATLFVMPASAAVDGMINEGGHWAVNSPKHDEIISGKAGEETTFWEVPWLRATPTLDGKIGKGEYLPFEMYEDYLAYMAVATGNTEEDFAEFYELTRYGFFDAYWGWDGVYMYIAFEVDTVNGHTCTPEVLGGNSYLYAYNMLQVGIAPTDSTGRGQNNSYVELGYGVHSETGESLAHSWMGPYRPESNTDFVGSYDKINQKVVYEVRIHLQSALGLKDSVVENGDQINYAWLLSVNGEETSVDNYWQVGFCHGIGGQYSHKMTEYFARITFTGKPDDVEIKPEEIPGVSEEDLEYDLQEFVDMSNEKVVNSFIAEDCSIEKMTEGDDTFIRVTALGDLPYIWSKDYPRSLRADLGPYAVVKYRTTSAKAEELGHIYRSARVPEYDLEDMLYTETLETDGQWRYVVYDMSFEENWRDWIVNTGLAPFAGAEEFLGETIDIAWIKYYGVDPYDLYESMQPVESEPDSEPVSEPESDSEPVSEPVSESEPESESASAPTESDSAEGSVAESASAADSASESDSAAEEKSGCGATVLGSVAVLMSAAAAAVVLKKKEHI
ncbi:MAG: hypothetical protein J6D87_00815 [Clostridia bacterium]|nr:hypothetical protein [Clostridia bacterium]